MTDQLVVGGQLGNYLIDSVIGRGGMSVVFGAKHARLGMPVALKVLAPELSTDDTFRERFLREAQIAAGIDHPNVIPIHDMGLHEDSLYIVMRYVAGGDLKTLLSESGPLELERALTLLMPIALALDTAHAHGLVHRDVKPANILIQRSTAGEIEHVYLTDFGIAKSASFSGALTGAGASIGTVGYMAPEQLEGREVSAQTDVYALAVTFYECLTGRIPFQRELAEGIRPPVGPLEPVSRVRPDVPSALDDVIARALSRDPAERYATCEQFLGACRDAAAPSADQTTGAISHPSADLASPDEAPVVAHGAESPPPAGEGSRAASGGFLAISTTDGINYYGPPVQALTTSGDTSVSSILAFPRFPSGRRSGGHALVYMASLLVNVAASALAREVFFCHVGEGHVGEGAAAVAETRPEAAPAASAPVPATA